MWPGSFQTFANRVCVSSLFALGLPALETVMLKQIILSAVNDFKAYCVTVDQFIFSAT